MVQPRFYRVEKSESNASASDQKLLAGVFAEAFGTSLAPGDDEVGGNFL